MKTGEITKDPTYLPVTLQQPPSNSNLQNNPLQTPINQAFNQGSNPNLKSNPIQTGNNQKDNPNILVQPPPSLPIMKNQPQNLTNTGNPPYSAPYSNPQYGDVAEEIKELRKNNYPKFNLTNELSKKNLQPNVEVPI